MTEEGRQRVASGASRAEQHEARSGVGTTGTRRKCQAKYNLRNYGSQSGTRRRYEENHPSRKAERKGKGAIRNGENSRESETNSGNGAELE